MLINYAIYRIIAGAESLVGGFVLFSAVTTGLRIVVTVLALGEPIGWRVWAALGLLAGAKVLMR